MTFVETPWERLVKPSLVGVEPYDPGESVSALKARYGLDEVWKLNWNEHLGGPLPGVLEAVEAELANAWMYPEQAYADLRDALAAWLGIPRSQIVPAHGIQALVTMIVAAFVRPGDRVVVPRPTYGLYAQVCTAAGAEVVRVPVRRDDLRVDLEAAVAAAADHRARLVWIADPNNPTGSIVTRAEWEASLGALPDGCVAIVDEAYREYVEPSALIRREDDIAAGRPVLLMRTFSKIFGLAGLRLGYAIASDELASYLDVVQEPFNVNRAALAAGTASLARVGLLGDRRAETAAARGVLSQALLDAGCEPLPSQANFVLTRLGVDDDVALAEALLRRGLLVRPGREFGLAGSARITTGPEAVMRRVGAEIAAAKLALDG